MQCIQCMQAELNDALGMACGYKDGREYQAAMRAVLLALSSPTKVAWAPEFGAALVATEVHVPYRQSMIQAICLDTWTESIHREDSTGVHTATADAADAHLRPIATTTPGAIALPDLNDSVHEATKQQTKKSQSAGFFTYVAAQHAAELTALTAGGFRVDSSAVRNVVHAGAAAQSGGFRDVGNHTTAKPLPTCWPLVQHALRFFAQQVRFFRLLLPFRRVIAVAHTLLAAAAAAAHPCNLDRSMRINAAAAAAVAGLCSRGPTSHSLGTALGTIITRTRAALDSTVLAKQRACCARAELPPQSHSAVAALLQPFAVTIPPLATHTASTSDNEARATANLGPLPELPVKGDVSALHAWVGSMTEHGDDREHTSLVMHEVEEWFHTAALDGLHSRRRAPLPHTQLRVLCAVLTQYADVVHKYEQAAFGGAAEQPPLLQVESRSRETLLVWITLCLCHCTAKEEFPALHKYALPVQPDSLRHLSLRGKAATAVALVVAAYVQKVNCGATAGYVFSTQEDATLDLAAEFASKSGALCGILEAEAALADQRREERWGVVQEKQRVVNELTKEFTAAQVIVRQLTKTLQSVRRDLDAAIVLAQDRCAVAEQVLQRQLRLDQAADVARQASVATTRGKQAGQAAAPPGGAAGRSGGGGREVFPTRGEAQAEARREQTEAKKLLQSLKADREGRTTATSAPEGRAFVEARQAVRKAEGHAGKLQKEISKASEPPPRLEQPLPDVGMHRRFVLGLLFFLFPQHTGALAQLRQLTCAAQQCFAPSRPSSAVDRHVGRDYVTWASHYNSTHAACKYGARPGRAAEEEDVTQLKLFRKIPPTEKLVRQNVMKYHTPDIGVVHASAETSDVKLFWQNGPIRRYMRGGFSDPFQPPSDVLDVCSMYTEPGRFSEWLQTPAAAAPSKLCAAATPCGAFCCQAHTVMDGTAREDATRGNRVLAHQDVRPKGMSIEEWQAVAGLRAFPLSQLRELCVRLHDGDLQLQNPLVVAAVRMALYQLGVLESAGAGGSQALRHWSRGFADLDALAAELLRQAERMRPAPKLLLQGALLCEIASHLAGLSEGGKKCARAFVGVAATWAAHFQQELDALRADPAALGTKFGERERELQAKCAVAHLLAVLCHVNLQAADGIRRLWSGGDAALSREDAAALCLHRVQADLHAFNDGKGELHSHLRMLSAQAQHAMAALLRPLDAAAVQHGDLLSEAVRSVFTDLPAGVQWRRVSPGPGCYLAAAGGQVYSVNLLSGAALCNGMRPGHLPRPILRHSLYRRVFQERTFEVSHRQVGHQDVFRTTQSHNGCVYTFQQRGRDVVVTECPVHEATGHLQDDLELQLLPETCDWCPELPSRLRHMHTHWLSRRSCAIVLRGVSYSDRSVHFVLAAEGTTTAGTHMRCHSVPSSMRGVEPAAWQYVYEKRHSLDVLWCLDGRQNNPIMSMLSRVESPEFIHVKTQADQKPEAQPSRLNPFPFRTTRANTVVKSAILFELPRFQMTFELQPDETVLKSQEHKGYYVATTQQSSSRSDAGGNPLPLIDLENFLILHPAVGTSPIKLLMPEGEINTQSGSGTVSICTHQRPEVHDLELYRYTFQPRTQNFDTDVMQYRLFLAAVFAATHNDVPIPQLGMTGGEHARQLLWQCRVNRPLSKGEAAALDALTGFSGHTPRLRLLCSFLLRSSESLAFLYKEELPKIDSLTSAEGHEAYRQAQWQYLQERRQVGRLPFVNARKEMTAEELQVMFNQRRAPDGLDTVHVAPCVGWEQLQKALLLQNQALSETIADIETQRLLGQLSSLLQINLVVMPFNRDVELNENRVEAMMAQLQNAAETRSFVCASREGLLSLKLKPQAIPSFDINDEVDSSLAPNPPLVYAWGPHKRLPALPCRVHVVQAVLCVLCEDEHVAELLQDPAVAEIHHHSGRLGGLPEIRLPGGAALDAVWPELARRLCRALMRIRPGSGVGPSLHWLTVLEGSEQEDIIQCCTSAALNPALVLSRPAYEAEERAHVLMLRGLLCHRLLEHCLRKRHWVSYGTTDRPGTKHTEMVVPFTACGTPSRRSEFKHDDVKLVLTQLAYSQGGLTEEQVREGLEVLLKAAPSQQEVLHKLFIQRSARDTPETEAAQLASIDSPSKIDLSHASQAQVLFKFLRHNTFFINFWLETCVFEREAKYFPQSLRQTAWHLADTATGKVVGFSGTTDNSSLLPLQVQAQDTEDASIRGTNAQMVSLLLQPGKCSFTQLDCEGNASVPVSHHVLDYTVQAHADALVDAGALLAGKALYDAAVYLVDKLQAAGTARGGRVAKGVVFFLEATGRPAHLRHLATGWCMLDMQKHCIEKARSPIKEDEALVLIGDAQCRGTDMKLAPTARAVLTLGPDMRRQDLMQAAARMRQLARGQSVAVVAREEVCRAVREICQLAPAATISMADVIGWTMWNTSRASWKEFPEFLAQGKHFAHSLGKPIFAEMEDSTLEGMYGHSSHAQSLEDFLDRDLVANGVQPTQLCPEGAHSMAMLRQHAMARGHDVISTESGVAEECEREVQQQEEEETTQEEADRVVAHLEPRAEKDWSKPGDVLKMRSVAEFRENQDKVK
eukprot:jgi/Ulvmu1/7658/UM038_0087.1